MFTNSQEASVAGVKGVRCSSVLLKKVGGGALISDDRSSKLRTEDLPLVYDLDRAIQVTGE